MNTERANPLSRGNRVILPYLILVLGFCFTLLVYYYFSKLTREQDRISFDRSVQEIQDQIRLRIATSITLLHSGTGLFAASDSVTAREFDRFVQQLDLEKNYPGVLGMGFSRRFSADEKDDVIADMERQRIAGFHIWPSDSPRNEYNAILYLQPATDANKKAVGYDMGTEAVRRQAMDAARDSGKPTASGRVTLIQEQQGFLIYMPVYRKGIQVDNESKRRQRLIGFVYSPFRAHEFLAEVSRAKNYDVNFQVYDGEVKAENLLSLPDSASENSGKPLFSDQKPLDIAGHQWTVLYTTKPSFDKRSSRSIPK